MCLPVVDPSGLRMALGQSWGTRREWGAVGSPSTGAKGGITMHRGRGRGHHAQGEGAGSPCMGAGGGVTMHRGGVTMLRCRGGAEGQQVMHSSAACHFSRALTLININRCMHTQHTRAAVCM